MRTRFGFTLIEILVVSGISILLIALTFTFLVGRRSGVEVTTTIQSMQSVLKDAQSRSITYASSSVWGVRFANTSPTPFYALFVGEYSSSNVVYSYRLPSSVSYSSSSIPVETVFDITFARGSGLPSTATSITLFSSSGVASSTLQVASSGVISY